MKIGYFIRNYVLRDSAGKPSFSGGVKVVSQHVKMLNEIGYETLLLTRNVQADNLRELNLFENPTLLKTDADFPPCDFYVATSHSDVKELYRKKRKKIVHLCQGYEPIDYESRIREEVTTEKYSRKGLFSFRRYIDRRKFRKRIRKIEFVYGLPTIKTAVSRHLAQLIERRYGQTCFLIRNGIDPHVFFPNEKGIWGKEDRVKILSVGSSQVGFKGIPATLRAVKILKEKGVAIEFIRVSPHPPSESERAEGLIDQYHINLKEHEMAELYRDTDIFISSSLEGEGFGLPAMEALASGIPSVLTEISSYYNFDEKRDFAYFVSTHSPDKIAEGVLAFIKDRRLRERCKEGGLRVARRFTIEKTKQNLLNFIEGLT
jgi:glycosyltransferase involved in cell wall biosynthesis